MASTALAITARAVPALRKDANPKKDLNAGRETGWLIVLLIIFSSSGGAGEPAAPRLSELDFFITSVRLVRNSYFNNECSTLSLTGFWLAKAEARSNCPQSQRVLIAYN